LRDQPANQCGVGDVFLEESEPRIPFEALQVFSTTGRKIIQCPDFVAAFKKRFRDMRTNETGATRDEHSHELTSSSWEIRGLLGQDVEQDV
jgi:hypothetical protein